MQRMRRGHATRWGKRRIKARNAEMNYAQFTFDRVEAIEKAETSRMVATELRRAGGEFGLDRLLTSEFLTPRETLVPYVLMQNWPEEWFVRYTEGKYHEINPVVRKLRKTLKPLAWKEAPYDPSEEPHGHRIIMEATEFGLRSGYCVPIHMVSGDHACVTFGGEHFADSREARRALRLLAFYGHNKLYEIMLSQVKRTARQPRLSPREVEVLKWCSAGKASDDIAEILMISTNTVETFFRSACRKLDADNRTQAVAHAIRAGLIP